MQRRCKIKQKSQQRRLETEESIMLCHSMHNFKIIMSKFTRLRHCEPFEVHNIHVRRLMFRKTVYSRTSKQHTVRQDCQQLINYTPRSYRVHRSSFTLFRQLYITKKNHDYRKRVFLVNKTIYSTSYWRHILVCVWKVVFIGWTLGARPVPRGTSVVLIVFQTSS